MIPVQHLRFFFEQRHQKLRLRVSRISARHKHRVDARQLLKHLAPFVQRELHGFRIGVVFIQRRIPDPDIQAVLVQQSRHLHHHLHRRQREQRAVTRVVRARRNQFSRVGSKNCQIADVLLPKRYRPPIVRIGFRPITELVAAQRILRRGSNVQIIGDGDPSAPHMHLAQQPANTE